MSPRRTAWVRGGLIFLTAVHAGLGAWILAAPESFFGIPWVNLGMDYNPHLMLDYGAMTLAAAVVLGAAAVWTAPPLAQVALASNLVWSVAHFAIHLHFATHMSVPGMPILLTLLGAGAVIPAALLVMATPVEAPWKRRERPDEGRRDKGRPDGHR